MFETAIYPVARLSGGSVSATAYWHRWAPRAPEQPTPTPRDRTTARVPADTTRGTIVDLYT